MWSTEAGCRSQNGRSTIWSLVERLLLNKMFSVLIDFEKVEIIMPKIVVPHWVILN
jgi:hypothetical protein